MALERETEWEKERGKMNDGKDLDYVYYSKQIKPRLHCVWNVSESIISIVAEKEEEKHANAEHYYESISSVCLFQLGLSLWVCKSVCIVSRQIIFHENEIKFIESIRTNDRFRYWIIYADINRIFRTIIWKWVVFLLIFFSFDVCLYKMVSVQVNSWIVWLAPAIKCNETIHHVK